MGLLTDTHTHYHIIESNSCYNLDSHLKKDKKDKKPVVATEVLHVIEASFVVILFIWQTLVH